MAGLGIAASCLGLLYGVHNSQSLSKRAEKRKCENIYSLVILTTGLVEKVDNRRGDGT